MDNNPGGLGGLGGMPLSADDRKLFMELLAQWQAKQDDPTFSGSDPLSFFEKMGTGPRGIDDLVKALGAHHFNTPNPEPKGFRSNMPEYDMLNDPSWRNYVTLPDSH